MKIVLWICMAGLMAMCHSQKDNVALGDKTWVLDSIEGQKVEMKVPDNKVTMQFDVTENKVAGMAGCNNFFGGYEQEGRKLKFYQMGATRMTCPDMEMERLFFKILENTTTFQIKGKELSFLRKGKVLAVFKEKNGEE